MLTKSPFALKLSFPAVNWFSNSTKDSSIITKSSGYNSSHWHPRRHWDNTPITITNSNGLRTEPWWTPTLTSNFTDTWCSISLHCLNKSDFPFLNTQLLHCLPDDFSGLSVERLFEVYQSKIEWLMFSEMFFMHLLKNNSGIVGTMARHETILHLIYIKWWSYYTFDDTFNDFHDVVQQFLSAIISHK